MGNIITAGMKLTPNRLNALANSNGINNAPGSTGTSTVTSYANLPATSSFSFTKLLDDSDLRIDMHISCWSSGAGSTTPRFGVQISSTDYDMCGSLINTASEHVAFSGTRIITGLAAGTYTIQGRFKRVSGTGTITVDSGDWISLAASEVV